MNALEAPETTTCIRIERQEGVGEQVVANPIRTVHVRCGGTRGCVHDTALFIQRESGPVVGRAGICSGTRRPRVGAILALVWDRMERPSQPPGANVVGADITGGSRLRLRGPKTDDDEVLVDDPGRRE